MDFCPGIYDGKNEPPMKFGDEPVVEDSSKFENIVCSACKKDDRDANILICEECFEGYHYDTCLSPPLSELPKEHEQWYCPKCSVRPILGIFTVFLTI